MKKQVIPDVVEITEAEYYSPAVTLIMPFEPKMNAKSELSYSLKIVADEVSRQLDGNYPEDSCQEVMNKLRSVIAHLDYHTHKKSIAIYVSPLFEKVIYLDMPVEQRIIVDSSFIIRDVVNAKQELQNYLVLLLSYKKSRIYLCDTSSFIKIVENSADTIDHYINDIPERVANFSDVSERKEVLMDKFLHHVDDALDIILNAYHLPLFVIGTKRIMGHFKKISRHCGAVISYVHGNYEESGPEELRELLAPHINDWQAVKEKDLVNRLDEAYSKNKLSTGIFNVWQEAMKSNGRYLVVERDFVFPALHGKQENEIQPVAEPFDENFYIKDAVDKIIEKVLETGGNVEFTESGVLERYNHIAMIRYY